MSMDAYQRARAREQRIWTPFIYSFPFSSEQTNERVIIFGLYSASANNQHSYLLQVETQDLLNIVNDYNFKMSQMTAEEQNVIADIVTKRYLANVDKLIHDNKMVTYSQKISAQEAEWNAKVAALAADRAQLTTLAAKVTAETQKVNARIAELQSLIAIESYNQTMVDVEIAEKEIELAKEDLKILDAANGILKLQIDIVNAAMELIEIDLKVTNTKIQTEEMKRSIAKTELLEKNLEIEQAQTTLVEAEKELLETQAEVAQKRVTIAQKEVEHATEMVTHAQDTLTNKLLEMDAEQSRKLTSISDRQSSSLFSISTKQDAVDFDATTVSRSQTAQEIIDADKAGVIGYQQWAAISKHNAAITAAERAAKAIITTKLKHLIQKL